MSERLQSVDTNESRKYVYIVTENRSDARTIEKALLYWVYNPKELGSALRQIYPTLSGPDWDGYLFESVTTDISDILAALTMVFQGETSPKCFRGTTSWVEH